MTNDERALQRNVIGRVNVGDTLTRTAARHPRRLAIVDGALRLTYREFDDWVNGIAHGLSRLGYTRGDRIGLVSGNNAEFLVTYYACAKLGIGCVPINLGWRAPEVAYVLNHSKATALVVVGDLVEYAAAAFALGTKVRDVVLARTSVAAGTGKFGEARLFTFESLRGDVSGTHPPAAFVEDRDPLQYLYTSGTTAAPKGAVGSHLAVYLNSLALAIDWGFTPQDRMACMMPLFHTGQLNLFCTPAVAVGAAMILLPKFEAEELLSIIEREKITVIFGLPMMYIAMLARDDITERDVASLRLAVYGMAPMPDQQLRRAIEIFDCDFSLMFGQTEMGPVTTIFRPEQQLTHMGSVGTPSVNTQVAIMADNGDLLPVGETGAIVYRSPQVMNGYLDDEAATEHAFRHGWFHSGDIGKFDTDGVLWFVDRDKDVIKTGGENVASIEVERAIYDAAQDVAEVAVVGLPHAKWSEAITAFVVAKPGCAVDPQTLIETMRERLDGFKVPKSVVVVDALPKTSTGKIQKNVLRAAHLGHYEGKTA